MERLRIDLLEPTEVLVILAMTLVVVPKMCIEYFVPDLSNRVLNRTEFQTLGLEAAPTFCFARPRA
jgi:hypothetical protein